MKAYSRISSLVLFVLMFLLMMVATVQAKGIDFTNYKTYSGPLRNFANGVEIMDEDDGNGILTLYEGTSEYTKVMNICNDERFPAGSCAVVTHPYNNDEVISSVTFYPSNK